ncbi:gp57 [Corynebacterium phage P1201]|uniref:Gp57 n=1 Tax=Corynebacterium phage P1201 TaxID=384848 RepID=A7IYC8_9CAUD|nr:gp57 [Corynebacterium phage P1201]ABF57511.1 gp57 [Corynebacterium phage P1201]
MEKSLPAEVAEFFLNTGRPDANYIYIIGIDPGVTTGISILQVDLSDGVPPPHDMDRITPFTTQLSYGGSGNVADLVKGDAAWQEQNIASQIADTYNYLSIFGTTVLVIEDFIIRKFLSSRDFLSPVRITAGIIQSVYEILTGDNEDGDYNLPSEEGNFIFFQSPSDAKGTCTDERLDKWGYTIQTQKDRHGRDATRHSVLFLRKLLQNPKYFSRSPE